MMLDRTGDLDPRRTENQSSRNKNEKTVSSLERIAKNTDHFKNQAEQTQAMMKFFERQRKQSQQNFRPKQSQDQKGVGRRGSSNQSTFTKIVNFRDGLVNPIRDYFDVKYNEERDLEDRNHEQNHFQFRMMNQKLMKIVPKDEKSLGQRMKEGFNEYLRKPLIGTFKFFGNYIIGPAIKKIGSSFKSVFFGIGKKNRTEVQAIDEQTQFLREGFIDRDRKFLDTVHEEGLLGAGKKGIEGILRGRTRGVAERAEQKKSEGQELSKQEEKALKKNKKNINLLSRNATKNEDTVRDQERNNILFSLNNNMQNGFKASVNASSNIIKTIGGFGDVIKNEVSEVRESVIFFKDAMEKILKGDILKAIQNSSAVSSELRDEELGSNVVSIRSRQNNVEESKMASGDGTTNNVKSPMHKFEQTNEDRGTSEQEKESLDVQKKTLKATKEESHWMTPFEQDMLRSFDAQNKLLEAANEMNEEAMKPKPSSGGSGGLMGMIGMGGAWLGTKLFGWLKTGVLAVGPKIVPFLKTTVPKILLSGATKAFAGVALASTAGFLFGKYIVNPFINWIDDFFGTDFGNWIGKITYNAVENVKAIWNDWTQIGTIIANSVKGITSAITGFWVSVWKGLWSGVKWLGAKAFEIVKWPFTKMWDGIKGMVDWVLEKASDLPLVGRFIDSPDSSSNSTDHNVSDRLSGIVSDAADGDSGRPNMAGGQLDMDEVRRSIENSGEESKREAKKQTDELHRMRQATNEQNDRMLRLLEQISGSSAATAANSQGDTEDKVFLRKDQQFRFDGEPL